MHDPQLSYRANGLLGHLRALPPGPIDTADLAHPERREGRDAVRSMLRELAAAGHVEERRNQDPRGHWRTTTHLVTPGTEKPGPDNHEQENPQVGPETGNPAPEQPAPEKPFPAKTTSPQVTPETDCPAPEKPGPSTSTPVGSRSFSTSLVTNQTQSAARFTHAHTRAADLNTNAVRADAYTLVSTWAQTLNPPLLTDEQGPITKAVNNLLRQGAQPDILQTALTDWAHRGRTIGFLRNCYQDAAQAARAATTVDVRGSRVGQPARPSTTDQRILDALALKERMRAAGRFDDHQADPRPHLRALPGA